MNSEEQIKTALQDAGLYENGMSEEDMIALYNIVIQSKKCAEEELEYRNLIRTTDHNCAAIHTTQNNNNIDKTEKPLEEKNNNVNLVKAVDIDNHEQDEDCLQLFPSSPNRTEHMLEKPKKDAFDIKEVESFVNSDTKDIDIDVFSNTFSNYKPFYEKRKTILNYPIYSHPEFLKLPKDKRAKIIFQYNMLQSSKLKEIQSRSINKVPWSKPIFRCELPDENIEKSEESASPDKLPDSEYVTEKQILVQDPPSEKVEITEKKSSEKKIDFDKESTDVDTRSRVRALRPLKRKSYNETEDLEDLVTNKKTKSNCFTDIDETNYSMKTKSNEMQLVSRTNDYTDDIENKLFDQLNKIPEKRQPNKRHLTQSNNSSDEEIFPVVHHVTADVHKTDQISKSRNSKSIRMPAIHRNTDPTIETKTRNSIDDILPSDVLHSENIDRQTCPICQKSFPSNIIERHASSCTQFLESSDSEDQKRFSEQFCL